MTNLDLAAIGNSIIGALIDYRGRISWCCFPRFDGDPVFCSLLSGNEPDGGFFDIEVNELETSVQSYRTNTAIVTTTLTTHDGAKVRITDFAPRFKQYERIFRPKMLVRRIEPEAGTPHIRVRLRPCFGYGKLKPKMTHGSNHIRYTSPDMALRLTTDAPISYVMEERFFNLDGPLTFVLGEDEVIHDFLNSIGREFLDKTEEYWHEWVRYLSIPFEWQEAVIRAAITLKLCSYEDTGAIVAALTTSIPEHANSGRNWDYRFCWLRDAYFVVHALNRLGATRTMEEFIRYIANIAALEPKGTLRPVYGIIPAADLAERVEPALSGYRGMGPVRVGNLAVEQTQNDSYGSAVLAAAQMFFDSRLPRRGDVALFRTLEKLGEQAARLALEPDAGLWEYRTRQRVHTHSVMMCWAACDRLAKIARSLALVDEAHRWRTEADRLRKAILENAWNETRQSFVSEFGGEDLDASLLLLYEVGFLAPDDPRFISTLAAIEKDLVHNGNLFRYKTKDDFGWPQTAFSVCTFWYIDALAAVGRKDEARSMFERLLAARNHVGLLSEDIDPATGELWGNFPQSYSMVGLIVSAMRLSKTWEEAFSARLVIVSNRMLLPRERLTLVGGLAVALGETLQRDGGLWFGWSGKIVENPNEMPSVVTARKATYATIDLSPADHEAYYLGYANSSLWPLFHYRLGLTEFKRTHYEGYLRVNTLFAKALKPLLQPDDVIWVHDYHFMTMAAELRRLGVTNRIGFFLHIPFPAAEVFRALPAHRRIVQDFCAYDLIGFSDDG